MNIVFFTENFIKGGMDSIIVELCNHWPSTEDTLTILCNASHPGLQTYRERIHRPVKVASHSWPIFAEIQERIPRKWWRKPLIPVIKYGLFVYDVIKMFFFIRHDHYDRMLVINGGYPGGDSCRAAAVAGMFYLGAHSIVFNIHNLASRAHPILSIPEYFVDRFVALACKNILVVSQSVRKTLRMRPGLFDYCPIDVVYNGVTPLPVEHKNEKGLLDLRGDERFLLMLSTYEGRKGHAFVLRAFKLVLSRYPRTHLVFCGPGSKEDMDRVMTLVPEDIGSRVHLLPFTSKPGVLLSNAYLLLSGSQEFESFGLTVIEAALFAVPAVVTNVGGLPEVVKDGITGYVVDPHDAAFFSERICTLLDSLPLRNHIGAAAREYALTFNPGDMAQRYASVIHEPYSKERQQE